MPDLKTLIVDDEPLARELLCSLLQSIDGVQIVGEAANGRSALKMMAELEPDLMFLDIQMPGMTGFDLIKAAQADTMPMVVFATAYDKYALDAFDVHAVDYVLKPLDEDRVRRAVERAHERSGDERKSPILRAVQHLQNSADNDKLVIKSAHDTLRIEQGKIDWVDAAGDYMCIHSEGETLISRITMKQLQNKLDANKFLRIHRSTIVNVDRVVKITPLKKGESMIHLSDGETLKVSRSYRQSIRHLQD